MESTTGYSYKMPERAGFKPASEGVHQAKIFQAIYLGFQDGGKYKPGPKVGFNWLLDDGSTVFQKLTPTSDKRGNFGPVMNSLFKRTLTEEELNAFDLGSVLGQSATVKVVHKLTGSGKTRAEISGTMDSIGDGAAKIVPHDFAFVYPGQPEDQLAIELPKFPPFVQEMFNSRMDEATFLQKLAEYKAANPTKKEVAQSSLA
jgi:hypothetical protein